MSALTEELEATLRKVVPELVRDELARALTSQPAIVAAGQVGVREASRRLGLGESTVRLRARRCELPSVKDGTRLLFRLADLDAYVEQRRRSPAAMARLAAKK